jgi:hypothetical protein
MRPEALSFGTGPGPSLVRHLLPAREETFSSKLPFPQGGEAFIFSFLVKGEGPRLVPGNALPGVLPQASFLDPFQ